MNSESAENLLDTASLERGMTFLRERMKEMGLKGSLVRDAVARAALERRGHFTADDLIKDLRQRGCHYAHTSTVYRTLPLLVRTGLLRITLVTVGEHTCYERAFEREQRDYLICTECQTIVGFKCEDIDRTQQDVATHHRFQISGRVLEIYGVCARCRGVNVAEA